MTPADSHEETVPPAGQTPCLRRCVEIAQAMAYGEDRAVEVDHLLAAAMCNPDRASRSRLIATRLGAHHFFEQDAYTMVADAAAEIDERTRDVPLTESATAALDRLGYWMKRTGDRNADSAHLLLVCLEAGASDKEGQRALRDMGITVRDVVREAMSVRHQVSAPDRQSALRGPIVSERRPERPAPYAFENPGRANAGPRSMRSFAWRSQMTGAAHINSHVQSHLIRLHLWSLIVAWLLSISLLAATWYAAVTVTAWSALWPAGQLRRLQAPLAVRLGLDVVLVMASVVLGIPWWLPVLAVANRAVDIVEGRLALLQVRGDTADPSVSEKDLRSDRRANIRARNFYVELKLKRKLASE